MVIEDDSGAANKIVVLQYYKMTPVSMTARVQESLPSADNRIDGGITDGDSAAARDETRSPSSKWYHD